MLISFFEAAYGQEPVLLRDPYLYISPTEVTNSQYNEFLKEMKQKDSIGYVCYLPDTNQWQKVMGDAEDYILYYHRHPAYLDYPVVNISHESAKAYCNWLTNKLNKYGSNTVEVRLPTEKEWEMAAQGNHDGFYPWDGDLPWQSEGKNAGKMLANFKRGKGDYMGIAGNLNDGADITNKVQVYPPNSMGVYDMAGNVSEMIATEGVTKGGSWNNRFDELAIKKQQSMDTTSPEIGFRYVVEIKKFESKIEVDNKLDDKFFSINFIKINESFYGGKFEVSNGLYRVFLEKNDLEKNRDGWDSLFTYSSFYKNNYFDIGMYLNSPVVNVTKQEAQQFCDWLTKNYSGDKKVVFRLPTEEEWLLMAAQEHSNYAWKQNDLRGKKGNYRANFCPKKSMGFFGEEIRGVKYINNFDDLHDYDGYGVLAPIDSYDPNNKGYYNLCGNAAEIIADKDYQKGGSWGSSGDQLQVNSHETYTLPSAFVGFRVVAEVQKR